VVAVHTVQSSLLDLTPGGLLSPVHNERVVLRVHNLSEQLRIRHIRHRMALISADVQLSLLVLQTVPLLLILSHDLLHQRHCEVVEARVGEQVRELDVPCRVQVQA